ncbi:Rho1-Guanine Exchange Factor-like protein, partial [Bonamia ostreae]
MANVHTVADIENSRNGNANARGLPSTYETVWPKISKIYFPFFNVLTFNFFIILIQILMFVVSIVVAKFVGSKIIFVVVDNDISINPDALVLLGASSLPKIQEGQVFRFITPAFLHANFSHIFFNVFFQLILGFFFEKDWGHWRIAFAFFVGAWGATAFSAVVEHSTRISVGSSGALFAYLGFALVFLVFNWSNLPDRLMRLINIIL